MSKNALILEEQFLVRISFIFAAGFIFAEGLQNWIRGRLETHPEVVILILVSYGIAFVLFVLATTNSSTVLRFRDMALAALVFTMLVSWYVITEVEYPGAYQTDALAFAHYSAILFTKGVNPYTQDLQSALAMFSVDPQFITLTPNGGIVSNLNYPALQFLLLVPVVWLGLHDARIVVYLFEIASIIIIYFWSPREIRSMALIALFAGSDLAINFTAGAVSDFLWVLPLIIMVIFIDKPRIAGIAFGLASAIKQTPWLLAPFLLVWFMRSKPELALKQRLTRTANFAILALAAFLLPNIGFMVSNLGAWYSGVVTPAFGNLVVLSQGLSLITLASGVPLPPTFYLMTTLIIAAALLVNYFVYFERLAYAVWAFPAIILWFSYRGLQNYFIFWTPLLVLSAVILYWKMGGHAQG
jgi:uncharacterized membrane protein